MAPSAVPLQCLPVIRFCPIYCHDFSPSLWIERVRRGGEGRGGIHISGDPASLRWGGGANGRGRRVSRCQEGDEWGRRVKESGEHKRVGEGVLQEGKVPKLVYGMRGRQVDRAEIDHSSAENEATATATVALKILPFQNVSSQKHCKQQNITGDDNDDDIPLSLLQRFQYHTFAILNDAPLIFALSSNPPQVYPPRQFLCRSFPPPPRASIPIPRPCSPLSFSSAQYPRLVLYLILPLPLPFSCFVHS